MKKICLTLLTLLSVYQLASAQWTTSGTNIYNSNTGNVGIGTTSPAAPLNVAGGGVTTSLSNVATTLTTRINTANPPVVLGIGYVSSDNPMIQAFNSSTSTANHLILNPFGGNVGIGTTSPAVNLDVVNTLTGPHTSNRSIFRAIDSYNSGSNGQFFQVIGAGDGTNYTNMNLISNYGYLSFGARADGNATATNTLNILTNGNVGIGTADTKTYMFAVNGPAIAVSMTVKLNANWPDYVFKPAYRLPLLSEVKTFIDQHQHLPEMPSEAEIAKDGLNLGEINKLLTKKVEELTLYLIEQEKIQKEQQEQINQLNESMKQLLKK